MMLDNAHIHHANYLKIFWRNRRKRWKAPFYLCKARRLTSCKGFLVCELCYVVRGLRSAMSGLGLWCVVCGLWFGVCGQ